MKTLILTVALGVASVSVCAQGTLVFSNVGPGLNAKVTDWSTGVGFIGSTWSLELPAAGRSPRKCAFGIRLMAVPGTNVSGGVLVPA
jgi:hypothetical protein